MMKTFLAIAYITYNSGGRVVARKQIGEFRLVGDAIDQIFYTL